jgi:hypothetical protein
MMKRSRLAASLVPTLAMMVVSCGGTGEGLAPVTGKVICDGQPAAGAILLLHRQPGEPAPPPAAAGVIPSAIVNDDGSFTVDSGGLGRGAAPGKYHVLIQWPEQTDAGPTGAGRTAKKANVRGATVTVVKHDKLDPVPADRLKGRYSDAAKPQLKAEVKPGSPDLGTIEITLK